MVEVASMSIDDCLRELFPREPTLPENKIASWSFCRDIEREELARHFAERRWSEFSFEEIRMEWAALYFFSCEAYVYFLPAYLSAIVHDVEGADLLPDSLVGSLMMRRKNSFWDWCPRTPFECLNSSQKVLLHKVLCYIRMHWLLEDGDFAQTSRIDGHIQQCLLQKG